jgi:hypothetical protein
MVFAVQFDFNLMDGMNIARSEDWKKDPALRRWLFYIAEMPFLLFFIKDSTSRFFMVEDDILSDKKEPSLGFDEQQRDTFTGRMFTSCMMFLIYCHNTGFQPDLFIDALIAEHDMPYNLQEVKTAYLDAIKNGFDWKNPST